MHQLGHHYAHGAAQIRCSMTFNCFTCVNCLPCGSQGGCLARIVLFLGLGVTFLFIESFRNIFCQIKLLSITFVISNNLIFRPRNFVSNVIIYSSFLEFTALGTLKYSYLASTSVRTSTIRLLENYEEVPVQ